MAHPTLAAGSGIALLEHVNLNVPLDAVAGVRAFFLERGLGLVEDPRPAINQRQDRLLWANAGLQQMHFPLVSGASAPQRLRGEIGIVFATAECIRIVGARLAALEPILRGSHFETHRCEDGSLSVTCPLGGRYVLTSIESARVPAALRGAPRKWVGGPDDSRGHPCAPSTTAEGIARPLGFAWVRMNVPLGSGAAITVFWRDVLAAHVAIDAASPGRLCVLTGGGEQCIIFEECAEPVAPWDGHHLCCYLEDFEGSFRRCEGLGLLYDSGRFADRGGSWELAQEFQQFRVLHTPPLGLVGGYSGLGVLQDWQKAASDCTTSLQRVYPPPAYSLELELRSRKHPDCPLSHFPMPAVHRSPL